jgi:hypothetical protein
MLEREEKMSRKRFYRHLKKAGVPHQQYPRERRPHGTINAVPDGANRRKGRPKQKLAASGSPQKPSLLEHTNLDVPIREKDGGNHLPRKLWATIMIDMHTHAIVDCLITAEIPRLEV